MKNRDLWLRIANADMPEGFVGKVSTEFSWTLAATEEAIREYRRFVYLSQIADHPLSPPQEVDLVWHMHLLYTRHYWGPWTEMLEKPQHHEPAPNAQEQDLEVYGATRALYTEEFDDFVAEKLWPSVAVLRRQKWMTGLALVAFFCVFFSIVAGVITQNGAYVFLGLTAFAVFIVSILYAGSGNSRTSFGVSSGGGGDGGCGD